MKQREHEGGSWTTCPECQGQGRRRRSLTKRVRLRYQKALAEYERLQAQANDSENDQRQRTAPLRPKRHLDLCNDCQGTGLIRAASPPPVDSENFPHVAIIGGGIGGVALAVACLHRGIPFTLYERDNTFDERSQGYGLTLQQASNAIRGVGISSLDEGIISTRHVVHKTDGEVIGEWGIRKWLPEQKKTPPKRTNIHIARQALRSALLEQLGDDERVKWGHQFISYEKVKNGNLKLKFLLDGKLKRASADLLVGADGIRSIVRNQLISEETSPLQYLGCIVILGICPLRALDHYEKFDTSLLDSATVFQTANGNERIYMMPFDKNTIMWQLSFPMPEDEAKSLSAQGPQALKNEAIKRCPWHDPIPQILDATQATHVSGYPAYDRAPLTPEMLENSDQVTLIGDAAHPMSPFKGQGANQALLDALNLARNVTKGCKATSNWREAGVRKRVLEEFETEMLERTNKKVKDSAEAAKFLHSDVALYEGDEPRGRCLRRENLKNNAPNQRNKE